VILSTADGASELRFALTVKLNPAVEKILSDGALVAGKAKMTLASIDSLE